MTSSVKDAMDEASKVIQNFVLTASVEEAGELEEYSYTLYDSIKVLHLIDSIRKALAETKPDWIPKGQIELIVRACYNSQYRDDDIETVFYKHGGPMSLLVLYCGTRNSRAIFAKIYALSIEAREHLARLCGKEYINDFIPPWMNKLNYARELSNSAEPSQEMNQLHARQAKEVLSLLDTTSDAPIKLPPILQAMGAQRAKEDADDQWRWAPGHWGWTYNMDITRAFTRAPGSQL
ncbi:hypothetical protein BKA64DRAFT_642448 [Cadophora sp. MPI-SDFR-AT-0126]|nr:hypothetical protein BKA64DRAFT_642448 [Leotiomycetes sp. MPI-SDFR-AT-0126]